MAKLEEIWIEHDGEKWAIRIDWDKNGHQRVSIKCVTPQAVSLALREAGYFVTTEHARGKI